MLSDKSRTCIVDEAYGLRKFLLRQQVSSVEFGGGLYADGKAAKCAAEKNGKSAPAYVKDPFERARKKFHAVKNGISDHHRGKDHEWKNGRYDRCNAKPDSARDALAHRFSVNGDHQKDQEQKRRAPNISIPLRSL